MDRIKRHSLAALGINKEKDKEKEKEKDKENKARKSSVVSATLMPENANTLDMVVESPPAIFYGPANQSTGALYAAQLKLHVVDPEITLTSFTMKLVASMTTLKPVSKECQNCMTQVTPLKDWNFLSQPKTYSKGSHSMPFSYLIPGHLPVTAHGELGRLQYFFIAETVVRPAPGTLAVSPAGHTITMRRELTIMRAVQPLDERIAVRVFPPTNLVARVSHFPVIHPIGESSVKLQLNGIRKYDGKLIFTWRLCKLSWRLEETEHIVSPACSRHANKVGGENKGIPHDHTRVVGRGETRSGWKTDTSEGTIEYEFPIRPFVHPRTLCHVESPSGYTVSHVLIIEMIVVEEWSRQPRPDHSVTSGAARILRMQHSIMMTERSGMGISWDEERPPLYEDVPASPPMYPADKGPPSYPAAILDEETPDMQRVQSEMLNYTGTPFDPPTPLDAEDFEGLALGPSALHSHWEGRSSPIGSARAVATSSRHASAESLPPHPTAPAQETNARTDLGVQSSHATCPASSTAGRGKGRLSELTSEPDEQRP